MNDRSIPSPSGWPPGDRPVTSEDEPWPGTVSPHVEDARDRLDAMNAPIPTPTPEQVAASVALENSRRQYRLQDRAILLVMHRPDVVPAARDGEPTLTDPSPTLAPHITTQLVSNFNSAMNPNAPRTDSPAPPATNGAALAPAPSPAAVDPTAAPAASAAPRASDSPRSPTPTGLRWRSRDTSQP